MAGGATGLLTDAVARNAGVCLRLRLLADCSSSTLTRMQPFYEVTVSRPWHWGTAVVSAPGAAVPETLEDSLVTAAAEALVIKVRHAQDIDAGGVRG